MRHSGKLFYRNVFLIMVQHIFECRSNLFPEPVFLPFLPKDTGIGFQQPDKTQKLTFQQ